MNTNLEVSTVSTATPELVTGIALRGAKGRELGRRHYMGTKSASELKTLLKSQGFKGKELTAKVNGALSNEVDARKVMLGAAVAELGNRGFAADFVDIKRNTAVIRLVKVGPAAAKVAELDQARIEEREKMKSALLAAGVPAESIDAALAAL